MGDSGVAELDPVDVAVAGHRARLVCLGLACCAVEAAEAVMSLPRATGTVAAEPDVHLLVVAGTVTHALLPTVRAVWQALPAPRAAVAFGACTISGGPYWDSYAVVPGLRSELPGAVLVAGCPPRPDVLAEALALAVARALDDAGPVR